MKIKLVKQEDKSGCTIACIAMVLGKTYAEVKKDFISGFVKDGMHTDQYCNYISDHGFDVLQKGVIWRSSNTFGRNWVLEPFAPVHILRSKWRFDTTEHAMVMDAAGRIYCPSGKSDAEARDSYVFLDSFGLFPWGHPGPKK